MSTTILNNRVNFGKIKHIAEAPDLLDIQLESFKEFFQLETTPDRRDVEGLFRVFKENFPITDTRNIFVLEFLDYFIDPPRYTIDECMERGLTYAVPLKAKLRLSCNDEEHVDFQTIVQDVFLGNIPYMTPRGTFVINGAERVVVSQLHRSPGVFFGQSIHPNGTKIYSARVIPFKGAWMEFATDINNVMYAYIDRKKKFPVTTLLRSIGFETDKDILELFGMADEVKADKKTLANQVGRKLAARVLRTWVEDFVDEDTGEVVSIERNEIVMERDTVLDEDAINLIIEMGANKPGDIKELAEIAEPNYGIITNIGKAHLEGFINFEGVLKTKLELFDFISSSNGEFIVNADDEILNNATKDYSSRVLYSSIERTAIVGKLEELTPFVALSYKSENYLTASL